MIDNLLLRESRMAQKSDRTGTRKVQESTEVWLGEPDDGKLRAIGGSRSDRFNNALANAMARTAWLPAGQSSEGRAEQMFVAVTGMQAFKPTDEIEGMLVAQAMAMHHASMECSRRAMIEEQPYELAQGFRKAAASASRTFVELLSALDRKRGKGGQQVVRVEHVHVHPGGKAIVGNVESSATRGGGAGKKRDQPHALDQLAHAPDVGAILPPLRSAYAQREPVPKPGNAERQVQDARRHVDGPAHD